MRKISLYVEPFAPTGLFLLFFSWELYARMAVITSVLVHELSHYAAMKMYGGRVERVRITAFGIGLGFSPPKTYPEEMFVAAAGPAASFAYSAIGYFDGGDFGREVFVFSLFLGIINMLPLASFDGNRIIKAFISMLLGVEVAEKVSNALSIMFLFTTWVIAVYILFYSGVNISLLLFCAYIFIFAVVKKDCNLGNMVVQ